MAPSIRFLLFTVFIINVVAISSFTSASTLKETLDLAATIQRFQEQNNFDEEREPQLMVSCSDVNPCPANSNQICLYGVCQCPHPTEQWYWSSRGRCEIDAGRPCDPASPMSCYANSMCQPDPTSRTGHRCTCFNGLESDGFYCRVAHNQPCSGSPYCNFAAGLGCYQGKCQCFLAPDLIYDIQKKRCVSRAGLPCMTLDTGYLDCQTGWTCKRKADSAEFPMMGVCE